MQTAGRPAKTGRPFESVSVFLKLFADAEALEYPRNYILPHTASGYLTERSEGVLDLGQHSVRSHSAQHGFSCTHDTVEGACYSLSLTLISQYLARRRRTSGKYLRYPCFKCIYTVAAERRHPAYIFESALDHTHIRFREITFVYDCDRVSGRPCHGYDLPVSVIQRPRAVEDRQNEFRFRCSSTRAFNAHLFHFIGRPMYTRSIR